MSAPDLRLSKKIATRLKKIDGYYGYLAWSEIFFREKNYDKGVMVLKELIKKEGGRPEAYFELWKYYFKEKLYEQAEKISASAFVKVTSQEFSHYFFVFCKCYAKSYFKNGNIRGALEILQQKYMEHQKHAIFLYEYGKLCIKSQDRSYLICGITALEECLRVCDVSLHGKIYFWLGISYSENEFLVKSYEMYELALTYLKSSEIDKKIYTEARKNIEKSSQLMSKLKQLENSKILMCNDEIKQKISETHLVEGVIAIGKSMWKINQNLAIEFLLGYKKVITRCDYYFLLFSYFKSIKDFQRLKQFSKSLLKKCKSLIITTADWIMCHIWCAKAVKYIGKPEKAIFLLKCTAKVFPNLKYYDIKYTKTLANSSTVIELLEASNFRRTIAPSIHIVSNAYLDILASKDIPLFLQEKKGMAQMIYATSSIVNGSMISNSSKFSEIQPEEHSPFDRLFIRQNTGLSSRLDSGKLEILLQNRERLGFNGFSLCSDPLFLYYIGKFSSKSGVEYSDGLAALEDYLEIVENQEKRLKANYYKIMILYQNKDIDLYLPLIKEALSLMEKNKLTKRAGLLRKILNNAVN